MLVYVTVPSRDNEMLRILDARFERVSAIAGAHLVCKKGCTACCHGAFAITEMDAARLRAAMDEMRVARPRLASEIERRAKSWLAANGVDFPGSLTTGILGTSDEERVRFEGYANDAACPALDPVSGLCDVYDARPITCRVFGPPVRVESGEAEEVKALGHCELCFTQATAEEVAECELVVPYELEGELVEEMAMNEGRTNDGRETLVVFALL
jgi:Fe-S-cluster containining protein